MRLHVQVRIHGVVLDDDVFVPRDGDCIGESDDARVAFPGSTLAVRPIAGAISVDGHVLRPGDRIALQSDDIQVVLTAQESRRFVARGPMGFDPRVLVATMAMGLLAASWSTLGVVMTSNPGAVAVLGGWMDDADTTRTANIRVPEAEDIEWLDEAPPLDTGPSAFEEGLERPPAVFVPTAPAVVDP